MYYYYCLHHLFLLMELNPKANEERGYESMATKNLGHYEGTVEDIDTNSLKFKLLDERHKQIIYLAIEREQLKQRLKAIEESIDTIREEIKPEAKSGNIAWAWIWNKKSGRVKWKQEFINALGRNKAIEVSESYQTKTYPQVGIQYVDPIPDSIVQIKDNPRKFPITKHALS